MINANDTFMVKSSNDTFIQRQKSVFDQLTEIEKNRPIENEPMEIDMKPTPSREIPKRSQRSTTKHFRGKESIFKKPDELVARHFLKKLPDFKKNPHKWTKYSLDDVKDEDISDKANTKAALSFLNDLKNRTHESSHLDDPECGSRKITFKRHIKINKEDDPEIGKSSFTSSKMVMPEYIVGQKTKKERKNKSIKAKGSEKQLKLDHLLENDEDE